jgi:hypothetical protein
MTLRLSLRYQAMSRPAELTPSAGGLEEAVLEARGYQRCEHCGKLFPLAVSRCRRRTCPGYALTWARDTMRKNRENPRTYGGLAAMCTLTPPGVDAGLVWDRSECRHDPDEPCGQRFGCVVVAEAAALWNEHSRGWWRELNRLCKQRADRALRRLGYEAKGGLLLYQWELQKRGVWHLHFVLGLETAVERVWAYEYVAAMRELAPRKGFGFVDGKPLRRPERAERVAGYLSKYLAKWKEDGSCEVTETVLAAGRSYLNYVSRRLTAQSGCTMRNLRIARIVWAWLSGHIEDPGLDPWDEVVAVCLLDRLPVPARGP